MQRLAFILAFLSFCSAPMLGYAAEITRTSYTQQQVNNTIANATAYISRINMSGYLIFAPNLTQAYRYLGQAENLSRSSPESAVLYSDLAIASAYSAYQQMGTYKTIAVVAVSVFTIIMAFSLYYFMRPVRRHK